MSEVQKPKNNKTVMSAINYYHLAQEIPAIERGKFYNMKSSEAAKGLKELVQAAKNNKLTLFSYSFRSEKKFTDIQLLLLGIKKCRTEITDWLCMITVIHLPTVTLI